MKIKNEVIRKAAEKVAALKASEKEALRKQVAKQIAEAESPGFLREVPRARRFPPEVYMPFMASCRAGHGSLSKCECIVVKLELDNVEKGRSIAELLAVEIPLKKGVPFATILHGGAPLPAKAARFAAECAKV